MLLFKKITTLSLKRGADRGSNLNYKIVFPLSFYDEILQLMIQNQY